MTRRILTILLAAAVLAVAVPVYADGGADAEAQLEADLAAIMSEHGLDEGNIAFGYRRTTDWTQFTFNEDALFESASVYKLALNMYYYEQEAAGNIAPDAVYGGMPLSDCHRLSLQYSVNDVSLAMLDAAFPDFADYKRLASTCARWMRSTSIPANSTSTSSWASCSGSTTARTAPMPRPSAT